MCGADVWPRLVQGQGQSSRLNIVWLYFVSVLYLLNSLWDFQITLQKCQVWWVDVQCVCLTKVGSRPRSLFKVKYCMNFTKFNNSWVPFLQINPLSYVAANEYSLIPAIAQVYDPIFMYKTNCLHPATYVGRHDCFRFRKHPSSYIVGIIFKSSNLTMLHTSF